MGHNPGCGLSRTAKGALGLYRALKLVTDAGECKWEQITAEGARVDGIAWDAAAAGDVALGKMAGVLEGVSSAAINPGAQIMAAADGGFLTYAAAGGKTCAGVALTGTTGAGQSFKFLHFPGGVV